jgi:hypothetical protein
MNPVFSKALDHLRVSREKHGLVAREQSIYIVHWINDATVGEALSELPNDVSTDLRSLVTEEPQTNADWETWPGPSTPFIVLTDSGKRRKDADWIAYRTRYRQGIESLRRYLHAAQSPKD